MLTHQQFERTRQLASKLAGIGLVERHRELLHRRSRRLGICDEAGFDSLLNAAEEGESSATQKLLPAEHLESAGPLFVSNGDGIYSVRGSDGSAERRQTRISKESALCRAAATVHAL